MLSTNLHTLYNDSGETRSHFKEKQTVIWRVSRQLYLLLLVSHAASYILALDNRPIGPSREGFQALGGERVS